MKGEKVEKTSLPEEIFGVETKEHLIYQAVVTQLTNRRKPVAHTKNRGEVSGGGIKPWRQKGTGRARHGSIRSPLWVGGGVTFGPNSERNFSKKINKKMRKKSILMALSNKLVSNRLILMDKISFPQIKTKKAIEWLNNMPIEEGNILLVLAQNDQNIKKSTANIPYLETIMANSLNVVDVLKHDWIVMPKEAIKIIKGTYAF